MSNESNEFIYVYNNMDKDIEYFIFKFEFSNDEIKNIICSFWDTVENAYPQIYSLRMYFIDNFTKINHFNIKNKYSLIYQYMYGYIGRINISNIEEKFGATRNFVEDL